jgi:hypothetical protein
VSFKNAFPRALEGLGEVALLCHGGGAKRVFVAIFIVPASPLVLVACCRTWRVPLECGLPNLGSRGERAAGGEGGAMTMDVCPCTSLRRTHFIAWPIGHKKLVPRVGRTTITLFPARPPFTIR